MKIHGHTAEGNIVYELGSKVQVKNPSILTCDFLLLTRKIEDRKDYSKVRLEMIREASQKIITDDELRKLCFPIRSLRA